MVDKVFAGTIVLPDRIVDNGYVLVGDGKVQSVGSGALPDGEKHGGRGFLVLPGAIDAQVHSRSQLGQEDFVWSTRSAAAGGVTTIVDMPYDDNCLICDRRAVSHQGRGGGARRRAWISRSMRPSIRRRARRGSTNSSMPARPRSSSRPSARTRTVSAHPAAHALPSFCAVGKRGLDRRHPQRERRDGPRLHRGGRGQRDHRLHRARPVAAADHRGAGDRGSVRTRRRRRLPGAYRALLDRPRL